MESAQTGKRAARYPFVARIKATEVVSGTQAEGLTTDLSDGGCCVLTRRAPFAPGTRILLEITKDGVSLQTCATVAYNLKVQVMGVSFEEMPTEQAAILAIWIKAAMPLDSR
jgi:PilZ domain